MPAPVNAVTKMQRQDLLSKVEEFASEFLADLERRHGDRRSFWCYMNFCSPMVLDLIAWERIHAMDLQAMPSVKRLFFETARAAQLSVSSKGDRDPETHRGRPRRTFHAIGESELAANILPRLEQILHTWGITYETYDDTFQERTLTEEETRRLTTYYGEP